MSPASLRIRVARTNELLATRAQVARSLISRMVGLLDRSSLDEGEGLVLTACRSIHTWGMRFAIDAVFVDRAWAVVAIWKALPPWRITTFVLRAHAVIELPAGTAARTHLAVGDRVVLEPVGGTETQKRATHHRSTEKTQKHRDKRPSVPLWASVVLWCRVAKSP